MAALASLAIRWGHVLAMGLLFGGAVVAWGAFRTGHRPPREAAVTYEWLFWAGAGVLVMTGVGNLASLGPTVPGPGTPWGRAFLLKLVAVGGLLIGSPVRTIAVIRWTDEAAPAITRRLRLAYAATAGYLLVVVALAEVLAHG